MISISSRAFQRLLLIALAGSLTLLTACSGRQRESASQTAAKVNKEEITVHQINFVLQQQRNLRPEQAEAASRQILERLIDQEIALQKAQEFKLDRDPRVVQQIEAARREIIARAYVEKLGEGASKPTPDEIKKYYDDKPALFKERRIYNLQELTIEAKPEQIGELRTQLQQVKAIGEFVDYLKANNFRFGGNQAVRSAEQLPLAVLDTFAKLKDGQAVLLPAAAGAQVVVLLGSRSEPVTEERARPAIEQFLVNDAKRKMLETNLKTLRHDAKIEYVGKYATAASAPAAPVAPDAEAASAAVPAAAAATVATPATASASGAALSSDDIIKGMGLKK